VPTVGAYARIGCYTEGYEIRALTSYISTDHGYMCPELVSHCAQITPISASSMAENVIAETQSITEA
jgi:hypothetical protein